MSEAKKSGQTVISIILPDSNSLEKQGSILAKYESSDGKQNLAHLMPFSYSSLADVARAIEAVQQELESIKANPPQITVPTPVATVNSMSKTTKATKVATPPKPKKKKPSLDDIPEDNEDEILTVTDETDEEEIASDELEADAELAENQAPAVQAPQSQPVGLKVGDAVQIPNGTKDMDGDLVSFSSGKVVEIDSSETVPRVWVESTDGEEDVWLPFETFAYSKAPTNDLSAFEKPIGMGVPNKEGQLTLFG